MSNDKNRIKGAEWLNSKGYDIKLDEDGMWMEELSFEDHKTKEVCDLMTDYGKLKQFEILQLMFSNDSINRENYNYYYQEIISS